MAKRKFIYVNLLVLLLLTGCNKDISKETIIPSNSSTDKDDMILQSESNHFKFYSEDQDKECLEDLSAALEDNYTRITDDLDIQLNKKVDIYIYSNLSTFHEAIGKPEAPDWVVGHVKPGSNTIRMVNPSNADRRPYSNFMKVIVHEFTHIVAENINSDIYSIPIWLSEGVAMFEANMYNFGDKGGYQFSYLIVKYIVEAYGYDELIALIKSPSEFQKIFGLLKEDFQKEWITHLK